MIPLYARFVSRTAFSRSWLDLSCPVGSCAQLDFRSHLEYCILTLGNGTLGLVRTSPINFVVFGTPVSDVLVLSTRETFVDTGAHIKGLASGHLQSTLFNVLQMAAQDPGFQAALGEARQGAYEGGVPIGACIVNADGEILGRGHNLRVQKGSATLHVSKQEAVVCTSLQTAQSMSHLSKEALIQQSTFIDDRARAKYLPWKTRVVDRPPHTEVPPCTQRFLRVICVPEPAYCTKSREL